MTTKVFHIEDCKAMRLSVEGVVQDAGFEYFGSDEWAALSPKLLGLKGGFAVLLADLEMPGINGEDFCKITSKYCPGVSIIILSGSDRAGQIARKLGCRSAQKAGGPEALLEAIRSAVADGACQTRPL